MKPYLGFIVMALVWSVLRDAGCQLRPGFV